MKISMMVGFALGAAATAMLVSNVNMTKIYKKSKKAVMHGIADILNR